MSFKPEFPLVWNDSLRSAFVSCPRAAFWEFFHHFRSPQPNTHLHAGKAWASALETTRLAYYGDGLDAATAQALGLQNLIQVYGPDFIPPPFGTEANKTLDRMMEAFQYYFTAFPLDTDPVQPYRASDGKPMVEFNFALPIDDSLRHPDTNEPILFAGRADMVATFAGALSIYDDKTTSQLGKTWSQQWNRRSQFSAYAWAAREYNLPVSQIVVRGIAILKDKINHAQALPIRTAHHIEEWHKQVIRDIRRAIECWKEGYFDVNLSDSCSSYGGCHFQQPCMSDNPLPWLESTFVRKRWNPVDRTETVIDIIPEEKLDVSF